MRTIFVIGLVLTSAFMAGWFTINRDGGETTIKINRDEIRSDAKTAINRGRDYLDRDGRSGETPDYSQYPQPSEQFAGQQQQYGSPTNYNAPQNGFQPGQYNPNQYQQGQAAPASWQQQGQQPYAQQPYPQQPNYQAQQPAQNGGDFYYPQSQQAQRPPAPWETNQPTQQRPQF